MTRILAHISVVTTAIACLTQQLHSQEPSPLPSTSLGRTFVVTFPTTFQTAEHDQFPDLRPEEQLVMIYSEKSTRVTIRSKTGGWSSIQQIEAGNTLRYQVPVNDATIVPTGVSGNTLFVDSDELIHVTCYMATRYGTEAWAPVPVEGWGMEYFTAMVSPETIGDIVLSPRDDLQIVERVAPAFAHIAAAYDNTLVTIEPTVPILDPPTDETFQIALNAGDVYLLMSDTAQASPSGPAGTRISSNRPVGVISGNLRASLSSAELSALTGGSASNLMVTALAPTGQQGTRFVYTPAMNEHRLSTGAARDTLARPFEQLEIYGTGPGITSGLISNPVSGEGEFSVMSGTVTTVRFDHLNPTVIEVDQPVQMQLNSSALYRTDQYGPGQVTTVESWSPARSELIPVEKWTSLGVITTPLLESITELRMNLETDQKNIDALVITSSPGLTVPFVLDSLISGTGYVWGSMVLEQGVTYFVSSTNGGTFSGRIYAEGKGYEIARPARSIDPEFWPNEVPGESTAAPTEYEIALSRAYSLPLTPLRNMSGASSEMRSVPRMLSDGIEYSIYLAGGSNLGLYTIRLIGEDTTLRVQPISPSTWIDAVGKNDVTVKVRSLDPSSSSNAILVVVDRTGKEHQIPVYWRGISSDIGEPVSFDDRSTEISVYPSVAKDEVRLRISGLSDITSIDVTNVLGQRMFSVPPGSSVSGQDAITLPISQLVAGIYFCRVQTPEGIQTVQFVRR